MEMKNVYDDPSYSSVKAELHKKLSELMAQYNDSEEKARSLLPVK